MLHVDFAESYKNDQQDAVQSAYFGNQCFRIFTAYCYAKSLKVTSMSCLQKVVHKIKHMDEKTYKNFYGWSDGMGSQFISLYIQIISQ